uniref:WD_REPEATS_REGION domain-containing protein n=1 Tax=Trichuris muris TaxID=70415 RepID=A0A5S6QDH6_TRIMR
MAASTSQQIPNSRQISMDYKKWKRTVPILYDMVYTQIMEYPSYSLQFLPPDMNDPGMHRALLGPYVSDEENYVAIIGFRAPVDSAVPELTPEELRVREYGSYTTVTHRMDTILRFPHEGRVLQIQYMPQEPTIIATKSDGDYLFIFDINISDEDLEEAVRAEHPRSGAGGKSRPDNFIDLDPMYRLSGHNAEAGGLSWNPNRGGQILSTSEGYSVSIWDLNAASQISNIVTPVDQFSSHKATVRDVSWHLVHDTLFASVADDKRLHIWDTRNRTRRHPSHNIEAHIEPIMCVAFSPFSEYVFATGSTDENTCLWDLRNLSIKLHSMENPEGPVAKIQWSPHDEKYLATSNPSRFIQLWNLENINKKQKKEEFLVGPPEFLMNHWGHSADVCDFDWSPSIQGAVGSIAEDNIFQIWLPSHHLYKPMESKPLPLA